METSVTVAPRTRLLIPIITETAQLELETEQLEPQQSIVSKLENE